MNRGLEAMCRVTLRTEQQALNYLCHELTSLHVDNDHGREPKVRATVPSNKL